MHITAFHFIKAIYIIAFKKFYNTVARKDLPSKNFKSKSNMTWNERN